MELDDPLEERHLSLDDIQELLAGRRRRPEPNKVNRMACVQSVADFAFRLETANAWPLAGPRIHHHDRPSAGVDRGSCRRHDAIERIIDRPRQRKPTHQQFMFEAQNGRHRP